MSQEFLTKLKLKYLGYVTANIQAEMPYGIFTNLHDSNFVHKIITYPDLLAVLYNGKILDIVKEIMCSTKNTNNEKFFKQRKNFKMN